MNATGELLIKLLNEREIPAWFDARETRCYAQIGMFGYPCGGTFAERLIKRLRSFPVLPGLTPTQEAPQGPAEAVQEARTVRTFTATAPEIQERGMYRLNGEIYKVLENRTSGRFAAHRLNMETRKYTYAKGIIYKLRPEHRLTLETVAAHGLDQLWCLCCGRNLDRKDSQERGIGPVCAEKYGY